MTVQKTRKLIPKCCQVSHMQVIFHNDVEILFVVLAINLVINQLIAAKECFALFASMVMVLSCDTWAVSFQVFRCRSFLADDWKWRPCQLIFHAMTFVRALM